MSSVFHLNILQVWRKPQLDSSAEHVYLLLYTESSRWVRLTPLMSFKSKTSWGSRVSWCSDLMWVFLCECDVDLWLTILWYFSSTHIGQRKYHIFHEYLFHFWVRQKQKTKPDLNQTDKIGPRDLSLCRCVSLFFRSWDRETSPYGVRREWGI